MPTIPTYPGVYIEEDASLNLSVNQGNTAIPVFIGLFSPKNTNLKSQVTRVNSWLDFTNLFNAGCIAPITIKSTKRASMPAPTLLENVKGDTAVVATPGISVDADNKDPTYTYKVIVNYTTSSDALKLYFQNGGGPCYILPQLDRLTQGFLDSIPELIKQALEITLIVCPEWDSGYQSKIYNSLTSSLLNAGYFLIADNQDKNTALITEVASQTATYYPAVKVSQLIQAEDSQIAVSGYEDAKTKSDEVKNLAQLKEKNPTVYQQAVQAIQDEIAANGNIIPVSAVMAGIYCATDASRGVWKAPANVVLSGISDVAERLTDDEQGEMNSKGINAIRYFSHKGFVVWGARTLQNDDNWRYIPVRRLFNAAERDIKQAMQSVVFEPNSQPTWERVKSAIDNYLYSLWQQGALAGNKPQEAYFVQIGKDVTMSDDDIKQGKMIVKVGMAAVRPAEFIILQFSQQVAQ
ncbi:phage tail sheath family protein [Photorhabdus laumondii subsp. laumondii]|uniref:Photorhabdus luminescens subsp. laumondii TTO1 complete genome segment 6/17 n=2 Tax=Photorhabdus laumondii subsp. laumondii TaxID=141679 RepID=Q7N642_PHOLL|nr:MULTISPECIES: phage tail sheath C-terminal domain-containing protein [Photorhabdus]AXG46889.1 phage tail sheath family protein [Photorhabdus laumondii subsp. laumondii]MCC8382811.1 phage tail sheath family protein [Photorhabdus laumondii]MCC8411744.1 phage tail sheath family protein [Photorhabdus laumondii]NDK92840.1 phage tail sheath family protein [Photorhabdus laumondii subsp. laumondii]NDL21963.1 phage tail sheath family protein [Photorhabdus laumondii subsp. laumondii]